MFICHGPTHKRFILACSRIYSPEEIFDGVTALNHRGSISLEYGPNLFEWVENDTELQFVCKIVSGDHSSYISDEDHTQHIRDTEDSAHTDAYEKHLAHVMSRKGRSRYRKKNGGRTRGNRSEHKERISDHKSCQTALFVENSAGGDTEPVASDRDVAGISNPVVCTQSDTGHDEWPNSTDENASGYGSM